MRASKRSNDRRASGKTSDRKKPMILSRVIMTYAASISVMKKMKMARETR